MWQHTSRGFRDLNPEFELDYKINFAPKMWKWRKGLKKNKNSLVGGTKATWKQKLCKAVQKERVICRCSACVGLKPHYHIYRWVGEWSVIHLFDSSENHRDIGLEHFKNLGLLVSIQVRSARLSDEAGSRKVVYYFLITGYVRPQYSVSVNDNLCTLGVKLQASRPKISNFEPGLIDYIGNTAWLQAWLNYNNINIYSRLNTFEMFQRKVF